MKEIRILSTAGLGLSDSNRLKTYCALMQDSLVDRWHIVDDFVSSHVCVIHSSFLNNMSDTIKAKTQVIILATKQPQPDATFDYQIQLPFTTHNVKQVLNQISTQHKFAQLLTVSKAEAKTEESNNSGLDFLFNFGKSLFKEKGKPNLNQSIRNKNSRVITERLTISSPQTWQILFMGSPNCGKSKAIASVCVDKHVITEISISEENNIKIDYGELKSEQQEIILLGLPSKIHTDDAWKVLSQQANNIVIMLDLSRPEPLTYLEYYVNFLNSKHSSQDTYCCFTHCDKHTGSMHQLVLHIKQKFPQLAGIFHIDARRKDDVEKLLNKLIYPSKDD